MYFSDRFRAGLKGLVAFKRAKRGNVAMIFALSLVPIVAGAGVGLDLARAMIVRTRLSEALDAAGLALGSTTGLTTAQQTAMAQSYFNANYTADKSLGTPSAVNIAVGGTTCPAGAGNSDCLVLTSSVPVPTTLLNVVGIKQVKVSYTSQVVWGQTKLWVALVLDNTGSMTETDSTGLSKISAEKTATKNLLAMLKGVALNPGDVEVSLVPFTTIVKVGTANKAAAWLTYAGWDAVGTGYGTYLNAGKSCTPSSKNTKTCLWTPTDSGHTSWTGCVMDRDQNYDASNTTPSGTGAAPSTLFQAAPAKLYSNSNWSPTQCAGQQQVIALGDVTNTTSYNALVTAVNGMVASGATNQAIGLAWGWQTMTQGIPQNAPALPKDTGQVVILLSDGLNTQDRWTGDGSDEDTGSDNRMSATCQAVKAAGITIYAVFVDLNGTQGNSKVLQSCASDSSKYFDLTTSSDIITAFNEIGTQITQLRVAR
ncbi:MAG TPA: pilus assembly protein TadG-related protein [Rhizomicrobium sp.]|jgi:Flp pilus assembly protein TadG|nr:pilus assembly protein TadG-related protein [Rhizomicrobium sp.]